jgi:hypothetical protein
MHYKTLVTAMLVSLPLLATSASAAPTISGLSKAWTYSHTNDYTSEIVTFDAMTNTLWVAGVNGVDILNAKTGAKISTIAAPGTNSVAIHNGIAALAIEANGDLRNPGTVQIYNTGTLDLIETVTVGALPDMVTFTPDGKKLLVANEGTPQIQSGQSYTLDNDPVGSISVINMNDFVVQTVDFSGVPVTGANLRTKASIGMDFEPEYITVSKDGKTAFVTLQEANGIAIFDLDTNSFSQIVGLGAKDDVELVHRLFEFGSGRNRSCERSQEGHPNPGHCGADFGGSGRETAQALLGGVQALLEFVAYPYLDFGAAGSYC